LVPGSLREPPPTGGLSASLDAKEKPANGFSFTHPLPLRIQNIAASKVSKLSNKKQKAPKLGYPTDTKSEPWGQPVRNSKSSEIISELLLRFRLNCCCVW